ncbi:hypothetical protein NCC78_05420 [Micromonospora phytophila]|nr:hypothetical protein [Micromonospora phytophila]MCM0674140.1 hypothetical protein [Micromonospora phytophila]
MCAGGDDDGIGAEEITPGQMALRGVLTFVVAVGASLVLIAAVIWLP